MFDKKKYRAEYNKRPKVKKMIKVDKRNHQLKIINTPKKRYDLYKAHAKARGLPFLITFEEFLTFWQKPCYYSGHAIATIGIDRIDNKKGYELNNIVSCCKVCNFMKGALSHEDFITWANHIASAHPRSITTDALSSESVDKSFPKVLIQQSPS